MLVFFLSKILLGISRKQQFPLGHKFFRFLSLSFLLFSFTTLMLHTIQKLVRFLEIRLREKSSSADWTSTTSTGLRSRPSPRSAISLGAWSQAISVVTSMHTALECRLVQHDVNKNHWNLLFRSIRLVSRGSRNRDCTVFIKWAKTIISVSK